jgi:hypothetical protein
MAVFSEASSRQLCASQRETRAALDQVRDAAKFVAKEAELMEEAAGRMRTDMEGANDTGERFDRCVGELGSALGQVEDLARRLEGDDPLIAGRAEAAEVEQLFSSFYTTEIERTVLQAALRGTPLPILERSFAGNEVELF